MRFDGWLLNIENKVNDPTALLNFVQILNRQLHLEIPDGVLIWYDSVTVKGNLNWQNGLTEKNKAFFDACDGIFTNYSWDVQDLETSVALAGDRVKDLYIGVDVWGRNFIGGGMFNTQEAVKIVHGKGCSMAIFAPAWTHEALSTDRQDINGVALSEGLEPGALFVVRDRALWGSLWPFLSTRAPCRLPFKTSLCRGYGRQRRMYGEVLCNTPWYNLRHQQYQPSCAHGPHGYQLLPYEAEGKQKDKHRGILRHKDTTAAQASAATAKQSEEAECSKTMDDKEEDINSLSTKTPPSSLQNIRDSDSSSSHQCADNQAPKSKSPSIQLTASEDHAQENTKKNEGQTWTENQEDSSQNLAMPYSPRAEGVSSEDEEKTGSLQKIDNQELTRAQDMKLLSEEPSTSCVELPEQAKSLQTMSVSIKLGVSANKQLYGLAHVPGEQECFEFYLDDAFIGGGCLRVHPSDSLNSAHRHSRLFLCDFPCAPAAVVCVATKKDGDHPRQSLNIILSLTNANDQPLRVTLIGRRMPALKPQDPCAEGMLSIPPLDLAGDDFLRARSSLLLHDPTSYVPYENCFNWKIRYYKLLLPGCRIKEVSCRTLLETGPILLGHFSILPLKDYK